MRRRDFIGGILTSALVPAIGGCRSALVGDRVGLIGTNRGQTPVHRMECIGCCGAWLGLVYLTTYGA